MLTAFFNGFLPATITMGVTFGLIGIVIGIFRIFGEDLGFLINLILFFILIAIQYGLLDLG